MYFWVEIYWKIEQNMFDNLNIFTLFLDFMNMQNIFCLKLTKENMYFLAM